MKRSPLAFLSLGLVMLLVAAEAAYNPSALFSPPPPSKLCCGARIKEQQPCICNYMKNPSVWPLMNTHSGSYVASTPPPVGYPSSTAKL
ncbi:hypothetical protein LINGRAHAP2_LOCUS17942 [Linum grandiflorum]